MDVNKFLGTLSPEKRKWVIERLTARSDAEAARAVGRDPATVCRWPEKKQLDVAVQELLKSPQEQALEILTQAVTEAARAKAESIFFMAEDGKTRLVHQGVASEILDRVLGRPVQRSEVSGPGGGPIETQEDARLRLLAAVEREVEASEPATEGGDDPGALTQPV